MPSRPGVRFRSRNRGVIDSPDARAFPSGARRTRIVRMAFAGAAVFLLLAATSSARDLDTRERGLLPTDTVGVAVVDLSLSIADEDYRTVRQALSTLIAEDARIGLVVFSDVPYELLPPGTPASEIRPMLRLLVPPRLGPPVNPWTQTFRAGTRISSALELARSMLDRDGVENGSILLVSDLDTAPDDVPALAQKVEELRRSAIELRVIPLAPSSDAQLLFGGLLEKDQFTAPSDLVEEDGSTVATTRLPLTLLVLGVLLFLALAAHERFGARLALAPAVAIRGRNT